MFVKVFGESITAFCPDAYFGGVVIGCGSKVLLCDPDSLETYYAFQQTDPARYIRKVGEYLVCVTDNSLEIVYKCRHHSTFSKAGMSPLKILPVSDTDFILVTKQCRFMYY